MSQSPPGTEALQALRNAQATAQNAIKAAATPHQAFDIATELTEAFRQVTNELATARAEAAARIRDDEKLSLAGLATRIGVSKTRADQLMRTAQARKDDPHV